MYNKIKFIIPSIAFVLGMVVKEYFFVKKENKTSLAHEIQKEIHKNPQLISDLIVANPELFVDSIENAKSLVDLEKKNSTLIYSTGFYNPELPIITEFFNFGCVVCKNAMTILATINHGGQIALKHIHSEKNPDATVLAQFMEAIYLENPQLSLKYINVVFSKQNKIGKTNIDELILEIFKEIGLSNKDKERLLKVIEQQKIYFKLSEYRNDAIKLKINSTPSFLYKGRVIDGLPPRDELEQILK